MQVEALLRPTYQRSWCAAVLSDPLRWRHVLGRRSEVKSSSTGEDQAKDRVEMVRQPRGLEGCDVGRVSERAAGHDLGCVDAVYAQSFPPDGVNSLFTSGGKDCASLASTHPRS